MDLYGIIGNPLTHSFSPVFFNKKFKEEGINAEYVKFEITDISSFPQIVSGNENLKGLNVTLPYKQQIMQYLDDIEPQTKEIGAVNVIKICRHAGKISLVGYNSDIIGFQKSILPLIDHTIHRKALVLGTGGASKAVCKGLQNLGLEPVLVSRTGKAGMFTYKELDKDIMDEYKVIVNASPVGTFPEVDNAPAIPYEYLLPEHLLYDLVYNPAETKFLKLGKEQGAMVKNGYEMLELQALAAWNIWNE